MVNEIKRLGHIVSLHYDIEIYKEPKKELVNEIKIFENLFETKINIISIHRPNKEFLNSPIIIFISKTLTKVNLPKISLISLIQVEDLDMEIL